ncbi:MAG: HAD family phosphatase [Bryobacteraceae bacterium]
MIKAVIFDLGKVIIPFDLERGYAALIPHCACPAGEIPRRIASTDLLPRFELGQLSPEDFAERLSALLGLEVDYARFRELWSSIFLPQPLVSEQLLEGLRRRYRMLVLSNTDAIHFPMVRERYPLLRHFDEYILSYQVGATKPAARIYEAAVSRAGCRAGECLFIDDIPLYVEAARQAGMEALRFESAAQLERELRARGLEW